MDDHQLPKHVEDLLPGMSRDFRTYINVEQKEEDPRHPGEDPLVRDTALRISSLIANAEKP